MIYPVRYLLLGLLCFCSALPVGAVSVGNLYSAELLVPEQLPRPAAAQLSEGLQRVLVKVSGRSNVANIPALDRALQAPAALLQQFGYRSTLTPISAGDGRQVLGQRLQLDFDAVQVNMLLHSAGVNPLGRARPSLLIWMAAQQGGAQRDFLPPEGAMYTHLAEHAKRRALPIGVPMLDLTDQQALDVSDLWGFFRAPIEEATRRYQPDAVLAGRLYQRPNGSWETQWLLINGPRTRHLAPSGTLDNQLEAVIDEAADLMFAQMAGAPEGYEEQGIRLEVSNVDGIDDFLQLLAYTRGLPSVESAFPSEIEHDRITLRVKVQGGVTALQQSIHFNPRISATPRLNAGAEQAQLLVYRWQE